MSCVPFLSPYNLFPNAAADKYNSNSYVRGLLDALWNMHPVVYFTAPLEQELATNPLPGSPLKYPGWDVPVPLSEFGI